MEFSAGQCMTSPGSACDDGTPEAGTPCGDRGDGRKARSTAERRLRPHKIRLHDPGTVTYLLAALEPHSFAQPRLLVASQRSTRVPRERGRAKPSREEQGFHSRAHRAFGTSHLDADKRFTGVLGGGTGDTTFLE